MIPTKFAPVPWEPPQVKRLANDFQRAETSLADVTGMSAEMAPNATYEVTVYGGHTTSTTTEALIVSLNGSAAAANIIFEAGMVPTVTTWTQLFVGHSYDDIPPTLGTGPGATERPFYLRGVITNGAAVSTLFLRARTENGAGPTATIKAGTVLVVRRIA